MNNNEPFLITSMKIDIDLEEVIQECTKIVDQYKAANPETNLKQAFSIILTENPGVLESRGNIIAYEDIHNTQYFDRENEAVLQPVYKETILSDLVSKLPFPFSIIRLSVLPPSSVIAMHTDAACHAQLAITTNQDCFVAARSGETKHVPVDSRLYVFSTTLPHTAFNASLEERIHMSISIFNDDYSKLLVSAASVPNL